MADIIEPIIHNLTAAPQGSVYAETFAARLSSAVAGGRELNERLQAAPPLSTNFARHHLGRQVEQVSKIISSREAVYAERDLFFTRYGNFDTHSENGPMLELELGRLDETVRDFKAEMTAQGIWKDSAVVVLSEFGRTISSNGVGTDHGWAGNSLLMSGGLDGGRIHGSYPTHIGEQYSAESVGRGRLVPTTSWEQFWQPIANWTGVHDETTMANVLPNLKNFPRGSWMARDNVFKPDTA